MEIRAKSYDKIAILQISGSVSSSQIDPLAKDMAESTKAFSHVIIDLSDATLEKAAHTMLVKIRDKSAAVKPRLFLVDPKSNEADASDLVSALDSIASNESNRIVKLFEKTHEHSKLVAELAELDRLSRELLKLPTDSPAEAFDGAVEKIKSENRKLRYLARALGTEIDTLKKQRTQSGAGQTISDDVRKRLDQAKKQALSELKEAGIL